MADIITIGRTHYYSVRKGPHQYRVAEDKKLNDPDCSWLVLKDSESGKPYYVNNKNVRRWHLPDIYQSEEEKRREEEELRFRRERKQQQLAEAGKSANEGEGETANTTEQPLVVDYAVRDQAALKLKPNREWEDLEKRRPVLKYAKSVLAPLASKGEVDDTLFPTIVSTVCFEFFASKTAFGAAEKKQLADDVLKYAQERIEERQIREAYRKMNSELLDKVKRIDAERKAANTLIVQMKEDEERMKAEIFNLRGHKQDTLLSSFKRLTRAGLINTYWTRWKVFKGVVEAQLHVRARERRALEMTTRISDLEAENDQLKKFVQTLQERVQKSEGRDVMAIFVKQSGTHIIARYFANWRRYALESIKEKQFYAAREQILNCPNCELREVDNKRVRVRLDEAYRIYREVQKQLAETEAERDKALLKIEQLTQMLSLSEQMATSATKTAAAMSEKVVRSDTELWSANLKQQALEAEVERLQFEIMSLSDFSITGKDKGAIVVPGAPPSRIHIAGSVPYAGAHDPSAADLGRTLGNFFVDETENAASKLRERLTNRTAVRAKVAAEAEGNLASVVLTSARNTMVQGTPPRGYVNRETEAAIAPLVRAVPKKTTVLEPTTTGLPGPPTEDPPESLIYRQDLRSTTDGETERSSSPFSDIPPPPPPVDQDKCDRCGFRKRLTPFCPKDGTRHLFEGFDGGIGGAGSDPLKALEPDRSDAAFTLQHRRTNQTNTNVLPPGLPPPEYRGQFVSASGERSAGMPSSVAATTAYMQNLRSQLVLDPTRFDPRKVVPLERTVVGQLEGDTGDMRAVAEHVRNTKMMIERRTQEALRAGGAVELPPGHVPLDEFRSHGVGTVTGLQSGVSLRTTRQAENAHRAQKPGWKELFDYDDFDSATFGIGSTSTTVFGVNRSSDVAASKHVAVPAERVRAQQQTTPNFSTRIW